MVRDDWVVGGDRHGAAAERIYAAATELVAREGLDALDIDTLAARVHCSRATIHRYAGSKAKIRDTVLLRLASHVVETVRRAVDGINGPDRVTTAIRVALEQIRSDPMRRLLISSNSALKLGELPSSPVLGQLVADLTGMTDDPEAAQWIVRVVMSLAYWPTSDTTAQRHLLDRFVAPAFT